MPRPIRALIDLSALRHNLAAAKRHAGGARVWAVIKANAYGHGLARAAAAFEDADGLAKACSGRAMWRWQSSIS